MTPDAAAPQGQGAKPDWWDLPPRRGLARLTWPWRLGLLATCLLAAASSITWGPLVMRRMDFFRLRRVEVVGAHYIAPRDIVSLLHVDTLSSVWDPTSPLARRVATNPLIEHVTIHRKLPGTFVVEITENVPIALVPTSQGVLEAYDAEGVRLPVDPSRVTVDAPVLAARDTALLRLMGAMRAELPALYRRTSEVQREGADELRFQLDDIALRTMRNVTIDELNQVESVESDLARRSARVSELDLRFKDQVIARMQ